MLAGLVGATVQTVAGFVPGCGWAGHILGEVAKHGTARLLDPDAEITDVKTAGSVVSTEQLDQINALLAAVMESQTTLLDRLETAVTATGSESIEQLTVMVHRVLREREDLTDLLSGWHRQIDGLTLSLGRIEACLRDFYQGQKKVPLALEEIKGVLLDSPMMGEWNEFRKARPEAVRAVIEADEFFLAGRREDGVRVWMDLLRQRGVGEETLCRALGVEMFRQGRVAEARTHLRRSPQLTAGVHTLLSVDAATSRGSLQPVWFGLPRGFVVAHKYRIEAEVGRGGMASVYRATGAMRFQAGEVFALKVPAPELMRNYEARLRFEHEIDVAQKLSRGAPSSLVPTHGFEVFTDPHTGEEMLALVLEFVDGPSLARFLAERQAANKPLTPTEILAVMKPVCQALEYAHDKGVFHRDVKPANVMLDQERKARLMDFGIARVLDDYRDTLTRPGTVLGTPAYMPPEFHRAGAEIDARSDVYLAGNLLLELLTFHPKGDPESRPDCPVAWIDLVADSMNAVRSKRPPTIRDFRARLVEPRPSKRKRQQGSSETEQAEEHRGAEERARQDRLRQERAAAEAQKRLEEEAARRAVEEERQRNEAARRLQADAENRRQEAAQRQAIEEQQQREARQREAAAERRRAEERALQDRFQQEQAAAEHLKRQQEEGAQKRAIQEQKERETRQREAAEQRQRQSEPVVVAIVMAFLVLGSFALCGSFVWFIKNLLDSWGAP